MFIISEINYFTAKTEFFHKTSLNAMIVSNVYKRVKLYELFFIINVILDFKKYIIFSLNVQDYHNVKNY